jgi:hypothetical protein
MKKNIIPIILIIEFFAALIAYWTIVQLADWRSSPPSVLVGSPDAAYFISRLHVQLGVLTGFLYGLLTCLILVTVAQRSHIATSNRILKFFWVIALILPIVVAWLAREYI